MESLTSPTPITACSSVCPIASIWQALIQQPMAKRARQNLLQRCVTTAQRAGTEIATAELPAEVDAAIAQRMAEADPQADVQVALACPQCHHAWQTPLDIVSYFWTEIHAWASRILREVHALAAAYGWSEAAVLALTPHRRQAYLEMI